ncbi:T-lymphocyte surface antigen Ly-9 isoform X2 [Perca flavescens]|uniref:T-lymphocyte surface antigen Ly-9 isoform X2 n=1 Tax=Perca flavescens TaxID=8167 RepID=UPI00106EFEA6|nr:T-lymphocyte surface antigen Ly-9-like isoform X2 [Perca flavescens]
MLLLLICWIIAGITAEDPPMRHYRVKNGSLCLKVGGSPPFQDVKWHFNKKIIVMTKNITPNYKGKVDYNSSDHSLCIKKLTETDSGDYKISYIISSTDSDVEESDEIHRLIVEDTVTRPVMRMSGLHSNLSVGFCNITVNCSIQDDWASSVCNEDSCETSQRSLFRKVNITIFTDNSSIICSGNNHVSTSNVSKSIETMCFRESNPEHEEASEQPIVIVIVVIVCLSLCAFALCFWGIFSKEYSHQTDTSTAPIIPSQPVEAQSEPRVSTSSSSQAEACYENVDATQPCQTSSPTISPRDEQSQKVDTVYSFLQVPNVTSSLGKIDGSKGHMEVQEALTSQYFPQDEAQQSAKIDTVYSVLQKPKNLKSQHHQ